MGAAGCGERSEGRLEWSTAEEDFPQDGKEKRRLERNCLDGLTAPNPRWLLSFTLSGLKGSKITHVHQTDHMAVWAGGLANEGKQFNTEALNVTQMTGPLFCAAGRSYGDNK